LFEVKPITYYALASLYDSEIKNKSMALRYYKKYLRSPTPPVQAAYKNYTKTRIRQLTH